MTIWNKIYNWLHRVKRYNGKGCRNVAIVAYTRYGTVIKKYDWSKPITYVSKEAAAWLRKESLWNTLSGRTTFASKHWASFTWFSKDSFRHSDGLSRRFRAWRKWRLYDRIDWKNYRCTLDSHLCADWSDARVYRIDNACCERSRMSQPIKRRVNDRKSECCEASMRENNTERTIDAQGFLFFVCTKCKKPCHMQRRQHHE